MEELNNRFNQECQISRIRGQKINRLNEKLASKDEEIDSLRHQLQLEKNRTRQLQADKTLMENKLQFSNEMVEILESEKKSVQVFLQWTERKFKESRDENDRLQSQIQGQENRIQHLEQLCRCGVCLEVVQDERFFKVIQPCYHTLCNRCVERLPGPGCPICRRIRFKCKRLY